MDPNEVPLVLIFVCIAGLAVIFLTIFIIVFAVMRKFPAQQLDLDPDPWRRSIDAKLLKEAQEKAEKEEAERKLAEKEGKIRSIQLAEQRRQVIDTWAKKSGFRCHCCAVWSKAPHQKDVGGPDNEILVDDWSLPGDLWKCIKCGFFTCERCMHRGVCRDHA